MDTLIVTQPRYSDPFALGDQIDVPLLEPESPHSLGIQLNVMRRLHFVRLRIKVPGVDELGLSNQRASQAGLILPGVGPEPSSEMVREIPRSQHRREARQYAHR